MIVKPKQIPPFVVVATGPTVFVETFAYEMPGVGQARWNVSYARQLVAAGFVEKRLPIARGEQLAIMQRNAWDRQKAARLEPPFKPGIAAPVIYRDAIVYILIDGMHRNARAFQLGITFEADLLTDEAAHAVWMEGALEMMPWGRS